MAAQGTLTDAQIQRELAKYGENIDIPIHHKKRPLMLKKLNHLRVRSNKHTAAVSSPRTAKQNSTSTPSFSRQSTFEPSVSDYDDDVDVDAPSSSRGYNRTNFTEEEPIARTRYGTPETYTSNKVPSTLRPRTSSSSRAYDSRDDDADVSSPRTSRLYPNLSRFRPIGRSDRFESSDSDIDDPTNKSSSPYSSQDTRQRYTTPFKSGRHQESLGSPNRSRQQQSSFFEYFPKICFILAVILFVVAATYVLLHNDVFLSWFPNSGSDDVLLICSNANMTEGCYEKEMVDQALQFLGKLFEVLSSKKGQALCGYGRPGDDFITVADLQSLLYKNFSQTNVELLLECCLQHILINPHWKIRALQENGTVASNKDDIAKLESQVPSMNILCRLRRSCLAVIYELCLTGAAISVFVLLGLFVRYKLKQKEEEQKKVYAMIDDIIDLLQDHYEHTKGNNSDESTYLAVQHVRDVLLPPARRQNLQPVWDKAVAFIAANESRVRLETRLIQGDEFEVWRWLQPPVPDSRSKKSSGLASSLIARDDRVSQKPTVCLKICNMLDSSTESDDDWEDEVIDAILEKCRDVDSIVHAFVDPGLEEGCVFIKCSNLDAAIDAKDELHGWRRKGQLVTVKYMKTEEYYSLFPDARYATTPLYPSARARW